MRYQLSMAMCMVVGMALHADAQSSRTKEYIRQIAALQVFINEAEKGYLIVEEGLADIGRIKAGEYGLHRSFFEGLSLVNPAVSGMRVVNTIRDILDVMSNGFDAARARWMNSGYLTQEELDLIGTIGVNIGQDGLHDRTTLADLVSSGRLSMPDGQRVLRIGRLYDAVRVRYAFVLELSGRVDLLVAQRQAAKAGTGALLEFYGRHVYDH